MIFQEQVIINGKEFLHTYSDQYMLKQIETGEEYSDAYDIIPCAYTYEETDIPLLQSEEPQQEF